MSTQHERPVTGIPHSPHEVVFAGASLTRSRHVCAFFNSGDEAYRVLLPFIKEGVERGDRALHVIDGRQREAHLERLEGAGIRTDPARATGQLVLHPWEEAHVRSGRFDMDEMIDLVDSWLKDGRDRGYPQTRLVAQMEWALGGWAGADKLIQYESKINYMLPRHDDVVICTYDVRRYNAGSLIDILRTHPLALIGGTLQENPFYVEPEMLLAELEARQPAAGSA